MMLKTVNVNNNNLTKNQLTMVINDLIIFSLILYT